MDKYSTQEKAFQKKLFIPGTTTPKNKANIKDKESLKEFEKAHLLVLNPHRDIKAEPFQEDQ